MLFRSKETGSFGQGYLWKHCKLHGVSRGLGADQLPAQQGDVESKPDINAEVFTVGYEKRESEEK